MIIRDVDCKEDTEVIKGLQSEPVYGEGVLIYPQIDGRKDTPYFEKGYLPHLLPLEEYDKIIVLLSGGKDSVACFLKLLEMGVPTDKIELWHHDIDGNHATRRMDWKCTRAYCEAIAKVFDVPLRVSYREDGFYGELYRIGASKPVVWEDPDTREINYCAATKAQIECNAILEKMEDALDSLSDEERAEYLSLIKEYGYRLKFPAKSSDLKVRWCSSYLKVMVADSVISNLDKLSELGGSRLKFPAKSSPQNGRWCSSALKASVADSVTANLYETKSDTKILIVSGERRAESAPRARLNEMEIHRTNAPTRSHRICHQWRMVIDYTERDVWEVLKRHRINPHPCYRLGWNRCSCMMCIFSTPTLFAGIRELFPKEYALMEQDEEVLGFTIDNKKSLNDFVGDAKSCVIYGDDKALNSVLTGTFDENDLIIDNWKFPCGAFKGAKGGPC